MAVLNLGKVKMEIPFQAEQPSGQITGDLWGKITETTKKIFKWHRKNGDTYEEMNPETIAEAVTCTDTQTVESKIGGIKGLAPSIDSVTDAQYAASALDVKNHIDTLNGNLDTLKSFIRAQSGFSTQCEIKMKNSYFIGYIIAAVQNYGTVAMKIYSTSTKFTVNSYFE